MTITSVVLQTIGPALLPPANGVEYEYYTVLGLDTPTKRTLVGQVLALSSSSSSSRTTHTSGGGGGGGGASLAEIRKAYKTQSLVWHPDKVAQRRQQQQQQQQQANVATDDVDVDDDPALVYQRIQEAATVLQDETQRTLYHDYNCSVARYRFVSVSHGLMNPSAVVDNVARAPWGDKTRLLLVTVALMLLVWVQPILGAAKINHENKAMQHALNQVSWLVVLIPTWLMGTVVLILTGLIAGTILSQQPSNKSKTAMALLTDPQPILLLLQWLEGLMILIGIIVLAWYWDEQGRRQSRTNRETETDNNNIDNSDIDMNWQYAAIPWWLYLVLRLARTLWQIQTYRRALDAMHSVEYIQTTERIDSADWDAVHQDYQDAYEQPNEDSDDEGEPAATAAAVQRGNEEPRLVQLRETVAQTYIVVHADPTLVAHVLQTIRDETNATLPPQQQQQQQESDIANDIAVVSPDELETIRVQSSAEYQSLATTLQESYTHMGQFVVMYVPLLALIVAKLNSRDDGDDFVSWWIVFIPMWLRLGLPWLLHFVTCCCCSGGGVPGDYDVSDHVDSQPGKDAMPSSTVSSSVEPPAPPSTTTTTQVNGDGTTTETTTTTTTSHSIDTKTVPQQQYLPLQSKSTEDDVLWATPEGDIAEFNVERASEGTAENNAKDMSTKPQATNTESGGNGDDDDMPEIDQEAFRKWQKRMEENEMDSMEENRLKAFSSCCLLSFQLMMLCLIVAKLEHDSDIDVGDASAGFNAFWVLFPLLFFSAIILLCCSCSIYAKPRPDETATYGGDVADATATAPIATSATVLSPPPPVPGTTDGSNIDLVPILPPKADQLAGTTQGGVNHDFVVESSVPAKPLSANGDVETGGNMDDLD